MLKRTPLYEAHQRLSGRLVEFGGWEMPVQYTGIVDEHLTVRNAAGIFDISHMGEVSVSGSAGLEWLNRVLTNDLQKLRVGQGQYTLMCNPRGGVVDDLYVYRVAEGEFLMVVNASRIDADLAWLTGQLAAWPRAGQVRLRDMSGEFGAVAVQGPRVVEFIDEVFAGGSRGGTMVSRASELKKNELAVFPFEGREAFVARTGYTGEDGFEVLTASELIGRVWDRVLDVGRACGLKPAGLGARDTLRTEVCYPLYGHELDDKTTPIEAGLGIFVALDKPEFTGREALAAQKAAGVTRKCVAFRMSEKSAPPRPGYPIWTFGTDATRVGEVVSGTQSPSLATGIGMGYVEAGLAKLQTPIDIEIRGRRWPAVIVPKPIYRKPV